MKEILRFTTVGSVDDGKSTLIGRILFDSNSISSDQLDAISQTSKSKGFDYIDLSLLTDGLKSEREQGITIDVAYRYFTSKKRKYIIADTPGHVQYTRNMVTGASTANLSIILIDARKGILEQTHRHTFISSLLGIPHAVVCINKMDLVNYDESIYNKIVEEFEEFSAKLNIKDIQYIPISALNGDNVVNKSSNMDWYKGQTLFNHLENVHISSDLNYIDSRFPIQYVIRPHISGFQDYRAYSGKVEGGIFKKGDEVKILPSGFISKIKKIELNGLELTEVFPPKSANIVLEDEFDLSRGDMIVKPNNLPNVSQDIKAIVTWMSPNTGKERDKVILRHTTNECMCVIQNIEYQIDINSLNKIKDIKEINMNCIVKLNLRLSKPIYFDDYTKNRNTGSFILINQLNNETIGAGIIMNQ